MLWLEIAASEAVTQALAPWPEVLEYMHARVRLDPTGGPKGPKAAGRLFGVQCPMTAAAALATGQTRISLSVFPRPSDTSAALAQQLLNWMPPENVLLDAMLALLTALGPSVTVLRVCQSHPRVAPWPGGLPRRWLAPFARVRHLIVMAPLDFAFVEQDLAAPQTVSITGYELQPDGTHYEHARRLAEGRWLGRIATNLESLELHGCGVESIPVPLPKLHTFSASFLPRGSLEDLTPALRCLYVSCSAAAPWHSFSYRDMERAMTTTTSLHATRLPASLQLLSLTTGPPGSFTVPGAPFFVQPASSPPAWPWLVPLLAAVRRNHPQGALHTLMIQAETQHLAELAAAVVDRWLGEEVPGCGAPLRSLRALSICPRGYYTSGFSLGMCSTRYVVKDMQRRERKLWRRESEAKKVGATPSEALQWNPGPAGTAKALQSDATTTAAEGETTTAAAEGEATTTAAEGEATTTVAEGESTTTTAAEGETAAVTEGDSTTATAAGVTPSEAKGSGPSPLQTSGSFQQLLSRPLPNLEMAQLLCVPRSLPRTPFPSLRQLSLVAHRWGLSRIADAAPRLQTLHLLGTLRRAEVKCAEVGRRCGSLHEVRCVFDREDGCGIHPDVWVMAERQRAEDAADRKAWLMFVEDLRRSREAALWAHSCATAERAAAIPPSSSVAAAVPWFWHNLAGRVADMLGWESPAPSLSFTPGDWYDQLPGFEAMVRGNAE